ncbi:hypothetical protein NIES2109_64130 (plasmid) [Nostoc sp. HK-01]|nr:hypothetical protein NIES2109_64130 [Nostoc sp. HK-01]
MISRPLPDLITHCQQQLIEITQHPDYQNLIAKGYHPDLTIGDAQTALTYLIDALEPTLIVLQLDERIAITDELLTPPAKK